MGKEFDINGTGTTDLGKVRVMGKEGEGNECNQGKAGGMMKIEEGGKQSVFHFFWVLSLLE